MKLFRDLLALLVIPAGVGMFLGTPAAKAQNAYITNSNGSTVSVINTATNSVTATIAVNSPFGVAVTPDGSTVYITKADNTVSVIDTATNTVTKTISGFSFPRGVAVTPDGSKVYVANVDSDNVSVIDTATNTVTKTITVGPNPQGVAVTPDGSRIYVANTGVTGTSTVSVIDTATNTVTKTITVGDGPFGVAVTPDGTKVYVTNAHDFGNVSVIDTATNTVTKTITVGANPEGVAVTPDGNRVYVVNFTSGGISVGSVSVIDTATNTVTGSPITVGKFPSGVAVTPDGSKVYVANGNDDTVSVIDTATNTVTGSPISVGSQPEAFGIFIRPPTPFAAFSAKLKDFQSSFHLAGSFTLGADSNGINPLKENVTLQIGTFSLQIPPGSFNREPDGTFRFTGFINGVFFEAEITPIGNQKFTYVFAGKGPDLAPSSKVRVGLIIGINTGTTRVTVSL